MTLDLWKLHWLNDNSSRSINTRIDFIFYKNYIYVSVSRTPVKETFIQFLKKIVLNYLFCGFFILVHCIKVKDKKFQLFALVVNSPLITVQLQLYLQLLGKSLRLVYQFPLIKFNWLFFAYPYIEPVPIFHFNLLYELESVLLSHYYSQVLNWVISQKIHSYNGNSTTFVGCVCKFL